MAGQGFAEEDALRDGGALMVVYAGFDTLRSIVEDLFAGGIA